MQGARWQRPALGYRGELCYGCKCVQRRRLLQEVLHTSASSGRQRFGTASLHGRRVHRGALTGDFYRSARFEEEQSQTKANPHISKLDLSTPRLNLCLDSHPQPQLRAAHGLEVCTANALESRAAMFTSCIVCRPLRVPISGRRRRSNRSIPWIWDLCHQCA